MDNQKTHFRLSNGLQSFAEASPEYSLAPVGIASMKEQAKKLAEYGRNGDIYVVHAAEGETVVPMEVLNANPQIKQLLFSQMKDMGLQPEEFIVGNELNSINPDTGLPEFFFKSIFRSVKNVVGKVVNAAKKIAPTILPIAATLLFPGSPILAGAIGGGLGSLAGGGSLKDAFKNALVSGGTAGLFKGGMSFLQDKGFGEGLSKAFYNPDAPSFSQQLGRLTSGLGGNTGDLKDFLFTADAPIEKASLSVDPSDVSFTQTGGPPQRPNVGGTNVSKIGGGGVVPANFTTASEKVKKFSDVEALKKAIRASQGTSLTMGDISEIQAAAEKFAEKEKGLGSLIFGKQAPKAIDIAGSLDPTLKVTDVQKYLDASGIGAGPLRKYGPLAAAGLGAAYFGGAFDAPPVEEVSASDLEGFTQGPTGFDLFEEDKEKFKVPVDRFLFTPRSRDQLLRPTMFAASGGVVQGPGTGTSDSIPAFLSDGEFVFTDAAVRGADPTGQGITELGANNLYNMMKKFEMRS
mgnify:CR=1 FL=1